MGNSPVCPTSSSVSPGREPVSKFINSRKASNVRMPFEQMQFVDCQHGVLAGGGVFRQPVSNAVDTFIERIAQAAWPTVARRGRVRAGFVGTQLARQIGQQFAGRHLRKDQMHERRECAVASRSANSRTSRVLPAPDPPASNAPPLRLSIAYRSFSSAA